MKRVLILSANAVFVILSCFLASGIIADVTAALLAPEVAEASVEPVAASAPRGAADRQIILTRNLFNVSVLAPTTAEEDESYEKTKLPLRLLGTAAAHDTALSWAAVEDLETKQHLVVRVDQDIKGGAKVIRIERRRVVLQNAGRREELALEGDEAGAAVTPTRTAQPGPAARPNARGYLERLAEIRFAVDRGELQNLATNPSALFSQARILPKYEGGQMVGVQVSGIKPGSWFEQAGIQNGETITAVNGAPIGADGAPTLFREITQGSATRVTVRGADGSERELNVDIRD
ncbi:MAG: type II secretion system protein GspC [Myxococcota bacterium]